MTHFKRNVVNTRFSWRDNTRGIMEYCIFNIRYRDVQNVYNSTFLQNIKSHKNNKYKSVPLGETNPGIIIFCFDTLAQECPKESHSVI